jgi:hypothetical protein
MESSISLDIIESSKGISITGRKVCTACNIVNIPIIQSWCRFRCTITIIGGWFLITTEATGKGGGNH